MKRATLRSLSFAFHDDESNAGQFHALERYARVLRKLRRVSIHVADAAGGVQGLPVTASRIAAMTLTPCLRAVEM